MIYANSVGILAIGQVRIHKFLEKTKKQKADKNNKTEGNITPVTQEQEKLRQTVTNLMKKQKLRAVQQIVKAQDDSKPWGPEAKAKV